MSKKPTLWECRKVWAKFDMYNKLEGRLVASDARDTISRIKSKTFAQFQDMMNRRRARKYCRNTCAALSSRIGAQVEGRNNV